MDTKSSDFVPDPSWPPIAELAEELWGAPNPKLSRPDDIRFGALGGRHCVPSKNTWFDFEANKGGGYVDLCIAARGSLPPKSNGHAAAHASLAPWNDIAVTYAYTDAEGELLLEVVRTISGSPRFRQRRPDGKGGWIWSVRELQGHADLLYRLPALRHSGDAMVWICEGEKDADNLHNEGLLATTNIGGAGKWRPDAYAYEFRGKPVVILADNDQAGREHAEAVARSLVGVAASVRVLALPGLPEKGDVSDWLADDGTLNAVEEDSPALALEQLAREAPEYGRTEVASGFPATPLDWDAMEAVQPRQWVYGHFLIRRFVSVLGAAGGTGKTAYAVAVALAIAANMPLLGETVHEAGNVWIYNLEDPMDELRRRVLACVRHFKLSRDVLGTGGKVFLDSGRDRALVVATLVNGDVVVSPVVELLVLELVARNIKLLVVDPFIRSHLLSENDNVHINHATALWAQVADQADCSILLVHHFRKGGVSGDQAAFRGASALIDASRAAISLARMSEEEAERMGVEKGAAWRYLRADNAKLNLAPPPERAVWLELVGVPLDNATDDRSEDQAQTVQRWEPKSPWEDISMETVVEILQQISEGPGSGEQYGTKSTSTDKSRWAGSVIVEKAGVTEGQARAILRSWIDSGLLTEARYLSPSQRKERLGCSVNAVTVSEMRQQISAYVLPDEVS